MRALFVAFVATISFSNSLGAQTSFYKPKVGEFHVDFTLPKISDRRPLSLSDYKGKKVLLLHFASW